MKVYGQEYKESLQKEYDRLLEQYMYNYFVNLMEMRLIFLKGFQKPLQWREMERNVKVTFTGVRAF